MAKKKWIQKAVPESRKGVFTAKANRAGKSVHEYAEEKKKAPQPLGGEARLALRFEGMAHRKMRSAYKK